MGRERTSPRTSRPPSPNPLRRATNPFSFYILTKNDNFETWHSFLLSQPFEKRILLDFHSFPQHHSRLSAINARFLFHVKKSLLFCHFFYHFFFWNLYCPFK